MRFIVRFGILLLVASGLMAARLRAGAQVFGFSATVSTNTDVATNEFTYTIDVTNLTGFTLSYVFLTNLLSGPVTIVSATANQGADFAIDSGVGFNFGQLPSGYVAQMQLVILDDTVGFLTNSITVATTDATNTVSTNLVIQVTAPETDLAVGYVPPSQAVITNDLTSYDLVVSNLGPSAATGVTLTNTFPPGAVVTGATLGYTVSGSNLLFNLGALGVGSNAVIQVNIEPTASGALPLSASVAAAGFSDPNLTNNTVATNLPVMSYYAALVTAYTNSPQTTNFANGLTEQSIVISNAAATNLPAVRVVVTGLTRQLFNAVGTNNGSPFVYYSAPLAAGQSASLLLRYNPWGIFPFTNGQLHAFAVPLPNWTPPPRAAGSTNVTVEQIVKLANGSVRLEFPSTPGKSYTVVYSDNVLFSNAMIAPPVIVAPANQTFWIDYGPPGTVPAPANSVSRFYQIRTAP